MRIIPNRIERIKTNPYKNINIKSQKTSFATSDTLEISAEAKALMDSKSSVRMDKVEKIKNQIETGTYKVSSRDVANKILKDIQIYSEKGSKRE